MVKHWQTIEVKGFCPVCEAPIYLQKNVDFPNVTVNKWSCEHQWATRIEETKEG
jgi:hypothetical protein